MAEPFGPPPVEEPFRGAATSILIAPPPSDWHAGPVQTAPTRMATASLVLGVVAMVLNVLLVPTVLAIVFGTIALGRGTAARGRAITGIVLDAVGFFALFIQIAILIPVVIATLGVGHHVPFHLRMASQIEQSLNSPGDAVFTDVECPVAGEFHAGKQLICTATREGVGPIEITATFTDSYGDYTYVTDSTPTG